MSTLGKNKEEISKMFTDRPSAASSGMDTADLLDLDMNEGNELMKTTQEATALEDKLLEMAGLIEARDRKMTEVRAAASRDLTDQLLEAMLSSSSSGASINNSSSATDKPGVLSEKCSNNITACEDIANQHIASVTATVSEVTDYIARQQTLLEEIAKANDAFNHARATDAATVERDKVVKSLEQGISMFFTAHSQLSAAATFYTTLQVPPL